MRFLQSEYKSIVAAILEANLKETDFSFVKKKGTLNIIYLANNEQFSFFRKAETILNVKKQWEKKSSYTFGARKEKLQTQKFEVVVEELKKWLSLLDTKA